MPQSTSFPQSASNHLRLVRDEDAPPYDPPTVPVRSRESFAVIPESVFALNDGNAIAVYAVLAKHADREGVCWPSMKRIEEMLGWTETRIRPAMKTLIDAGLVAVERRQLRGMDQANKYRLQANVRVPQGKGAVPHSEVMGPSPQGAGSLTTRDELEPRELDKRTRERRTPETDAPEVLPLSDAQYAWAVALGFDAARCDRERDAMLDWHRSKGNRHRDWYAAWRTWMRRTRPEAKPSNGAMPPEIARLTWNSAARLKWEQDHRDGRA